MKKFILLICFLIVYTGFANAQCTIASSCTPDLATTGYCTTPADGTDLPNGEEGTAYSTVIQVSVGPSAGGGFVTITDVEILNVILPAGLSYEVNPTNNTIAGGSNGCIEISGTPTTAVVGFSVDVEINANTSLGGVPYTISYNLTIDASSLNLNELNTPELSLFPNPAEDKLTVSVKEPTSIKVTNVLGTVVLEERINSSKTMNVSGLKNGIYFVTNTATGRSTKFVKK